MVLLNGHSNIHGRKQCKHIGLDGSNQYFDHSDKCNNQRTANSNNNTMKYKC